MNHRDFRMLLSTSSSGEITTSYIFLTTLAEDEFDLDEAVGYCCRSNGTHGADGVRPLDGYVVGNWFGQIVFAFKTMPQYLLDGELVDGPEYFDARNKS